jgi:hypothetical protein
MSGFDSFLRGLGMFVVVVAVFVVLAALPGAAPIVASLTTALEIVASGLLLVGILVALAIWRANARAKTGRQLVPFGWVRRPYKVIRRKQMVRAYMADSSQVGRTSPVWQRPSAGVREAQAVYLANLRAANTSARPAKRLPLTDAPHSTLNAALNGSGVYIVEVQP